MIPSDWRRTTIEEVCAFYAGGDNFEKLEYSTRGTPVLAKGDVKAFGRVEHGGNRFFDTTVARQRGYRFTEPGDFLLTTRDLTQAAEFLGLVSPIPADRQYLINQGANVIRLSPNVNQRYFVYWCNGPIYRAHVKAHFVGSTQIHLRKQDFLDAPIFLPPLTEQCRISETLGALDEKIELNRRMNETLEATVRAVFKSWFVEFDPVRSKSEDRQPARVDSTIAALFPSEFVDSKLGRIPKDWKPGALGDVAENPRRGLQPQNVASGTPYIALDHMPRRNIALSEWGNAEEAVSNKFQFLQGEFLFGKLRPYFHKVGVAAVDGVCSTDILVVRPREDRWYGFVLGHLFSDEFVAYTDAGSTGTKMPRTSWPEMARYEIAVPGAPVVEAFNRIVRPMIDKIRLNVLESRTLAALRDTLLPKLLSGEIRLKDVEKTVGAVV